MTEKSLKHDTLELARRRGLQINRKVEDEPAGETGLRRGFVKISREEARDIQAVEKIEEIILNGGTVRPQGFIKDGQMTVHISDSEGQNGEMLTFYVADPKEFEVDCTECIQESTDGTGE